MLNLQVNGQATSADAPENMPLLWLLRDVLNLTGTKFGCGIAACGACTVLIDGVAVRSCITPAAAAIGKQVRTIDGASSKATAALQAAWQAEQVPQCGYCQSGMLMAATALLEKNPNPSDADIASAITNLCRCGTYQRIAAGVKRAAQELRAS